MFTRAVKGLDIHMFLAAQDAGTRSHCRRLYGCRKWLWLGVGFSLSPAQADCNPTSDMLRFSHQSSAQKQQVVVQCPNPKERVEKKYEATVSRYAISQYSFDGSGICGLKISFQLYFLWVRISRGSFAWSSTGGLGCSSSCKLCSLSSCKASPASSFGRASSCISSTLGFAWYGCSDNSGAVVALARRKDFRFFLRKIITAATAKSKVTMAPPAAIPAMRPSLRLVA